MATQNPKLIRYKCNDQIDRISNPENYRGQTFYIHKEHNEKEGLIKRHVAQYEPKYMDAWIKTIEFSAYEDLKRQNAALINQRNEKLRADFEKFGVQQGLSKLQIEDAIANAIDIENRKLVFLVPTSVATLEEAEQMFRAGTPPTMEAIEIAYLKAALRQYKNKNQIAKMMGISRSGLFSKLAKYGLIEKRKKDSV